MCNFFKQQNFYHLCANWVTRRGGGGKHLVSDTIKIYLKKFLFSFKNIFMLFFKFHAPNQFLTSKQRRHMEINGPKKILYAEIFNT